MHLQFWHCHQSSLRSACGSLVDVARICVCPCSSPRICAAMDAFPRRCGEGDRRSALRPERSEACAKSADKLCASSGIKAARAPASSPPIRGEARLVRSRPLIRSGVRGTKSLPFILTSVLAHSCVCAGHGVQKTKSENVKMVKCENLKT